MLVISSKYNTQLFAIQITQHKTYNDSDGKEILFFYTFHIHILVPSSGNINVNSVMQEGKYQYLLFQGVSHSSDYLILFKHFNYHDV